jgi:hypothetical protein
MGGQGHRGRRRSTRCVNITGVRPRMTVASNKPMKLTVAFGTACMAGATEPMR